MPIFFQKLSTKNHFSFIKRPWPQLCAILIFLGSLPFFSANVFADNTPPAPLIIRVGAYENQPKIYTDESGKIVGLFPDVLTYIAQKEGWVLKYVHGTWSQCLERLEKNEIDLMSDVAFSEKRAQKYNFSN